MTEYIPQTRSQWIGFGIFQCVHLIVHAVNFYLAKKAINIHLERVKEKTTMATNLTALQDAIKLVADGVNDAIKAAGDSTPIMKAMEFENLLPDLMKVLPEIGEIPSEVSQLAVGDYITLLGTLGADLTLPVGKAQAILAASLKIISDAATYMIPDVEALIAAIKA